MESQKVRHDWATEQEDDCILSPCLFDFHEEYMMLNAGLDKSQTAIKIARKNINNLTYTEDAILMAETKEKVTSLLMRVKEESGKADLTLSHFMANRRGKSGNSDRFYFLGLQNHCVCDYSQTIKRRLLLRRKWWEKYTVYYKADITLPTKEHIVKSMGLFSSHVWKSELDQKEAEQQELMFLNSDAGGDSSVSLGLQGDQTNQL